MKSKIKIQKLFRELLVDNDQLVAQCEQKGLSEADKNMAELLLEMNEAQLTVIAWVLSRY
jgi:hypothetical protein